MVRRLRRLREEGGVTLIEMIMVLAILGIVLGGVTTVFISGSRAELNVNNRFQAQEGARLAMQAIRDDAHSACAAAVKTVVSPASWQLTLVSNATATTQCGASGTPKVVFLVCTSPTNSAKFALYRLTVAPPATPCPSAGQLVADNLINTLSGFSGFFKANAAGDTVITWGELQTIDVDIPVSVKVGQAGQPFDLKERLAVSNTVWSTTVDTSCTASVPCKQGPCNAVDVAVPPNHVTCYSVKIN